MAQSLLDAGLQSQAQPDGDDQGGDSDGDSAAGECGAIGVCPQVVHGLFERLAQVNQRGSSVAGQDTHLPAAAWPCRRRARRVTLSRTIVGSSYRDRVPKAGPGLAGPSRAVRGPGRLNGGSGRADGARLSVRATAGGIAGSRRASAGVAAGAVPSIYPRADLGPVGARGGPALHTGPARLFGGGSACAGCRGARQRRSSADRGDLARHRRGRIPSRGVLRFGRI
jgi:hypothetical protein